MNHAESLHRAHRHMGSLFKWLATARETGGAFALAEIRVRAGSEPPPHASTIAWVVPQGEWPKWEKEGTSFQPLAPESLTPRGAGI